MLNILFAGVGGQGTVLASKIVAKSAISRGLPAHTAETIGMAQRGGCVVSHVRIGEGVYSPLIPRGEADVIIGFEPAEAARALPYLKQGGRVVACGMAVKPVTDALSDTAYDAGRMLDYLRAQDVRLVVLDGEAVLSACGTARVLNVALLGAAAAAGAIGMTPEDLRRVVETELPPKFREVNLKALELGAAAYAQA
ncbi:MAG: indolepyruvate oxidoreductase subunit beta [Candidatus Howiella sp.]|jgi:indolepyruvate ferredoxin oxidoreductase beta subunit